MRRLPMLALAALVLAAIAPTGAQARAAHTAGLDVRVTSLTFGDASTACPAFRARLGLATEHGPGRGSVCTQSVNFCNISLARWKLQLSEGTVEAFVIQRERCTFDPDTFALTSVDIVWEGTVSKATGAASHLAGGALSGGGHTAFAADGTPLPDLVVHIGEGRGRAISFKGTDTGTFTASLDGSLVALEDQGAGRSSALGRYSYTASEVGNLLTFEVLGAAIFATRDGAIFASYSGFTGPGATADDVTYIVGGPITGGTGRYAGASGTLAFDGSGSFATGTLDDTMSGVVATTGRG